MVGKNSEGDRKKPCVSMLNCEITIANLLRSNADMLLHIHAHIDFDQVYSGLDLNSSL